MIVNLHNPVPILQQKPSSITTNTLIPKNFQQIDQESLNFKVQNTNNTNSINQKISSDIIEFFNEFYTKPDDENWSNYIVKISSKKNRFIYVGIFFISIAIYIFYKNVN